MPTEIKAQDMGPGTSGFLFAMYLSKRRARLYYKNEIDQLLQDIANLNLSADMKTREFWEARAASKCNPVLNITLSLRQNVPGKKQRQSNKYEGRFSRHCFGSCPITGYVCRTSEDRRVGFMCACLPPK